MGILSATSAVLHGSIRVTNLHYVGALEFADSQAYKDTESLLCAEVSYAIFTLKQKYPASADAYSLTALVYVLPSTFSVLNTAKPTR